MADKPGVLHRLASLTLLCLLAACVDWPEPPPDQTFTEDELAILRTELGTLPELPPDPTNRVDEDPRAIALGQKLFFDPRYSENDQISCATCHAPDMAFQDDRAPTSLGLAYTGRHAPTVINAAYSMNSRTWANWMFWDGRADSIWGQALGPPESRVEMGGSRLGIIYFLDRYYRDEYEAVFGPLPPLFDEEGEPLYPTAGMPSEAAWDDLDESTKQLLNGVYVGFGKAISAYERRIVSRNARFDAFITEIIDGADDSDVLTAEEKLGLKVFIGDGLCIACHKGPNFSDARFRNIGLAQVGEHVPAEDEGRAAGIRNVIDSPFNCAGPFSDHPDKSTCAVVDLEMSDRARALGTFKTPTLRDVSRSAPYGHTGGLATLEDVIELYDRGGDEPGTYQGDLHPKVRPLGLTEEEKAALVVFLRTLDGEPLEPSLHIRPQLPMGD
ncbi:MAG: cytochrome c peroxidase [Deltaproteobacteria bacterium]|jgi:cytochrome c peroxidase